MLKTLENLIKKPFFRERLPDLLSAAGLGFYALRALHYARTLFSTLDEGNYLYKGLLYVTGIYDVYQPYGPFMGKMPLSFLIPGWVQAVFGPGLRTGRYFALALSLLVIVCLWLIVKRLTNRVLACLAVWAFALNAFYAKLYSQMFSEILIAAMLALLLWLVLGSGRKLWQTTLAAALSALIVLTRHDILPVLVFTILYIFWEHGKKAGCFAALASGIILLTVHLIFWPEIIQVWLNVLPDFLVAFFDEYVFRPGAQRLFPSSFDSLDRLLAFWEGIRLQLLAVIGVLFALLFWPKKETWKQAGNLKVRIFLFATIITLAGMHFWASILRSYCLFCFKSYLSFYSFVGLIILTLFLHQNRSRKNILQDLMAALLVVIVTTGVGFSIYQDVGVPLLDLQIPRIKNLQFLGGSVALSTFLGNKFAFAFKQLKYLIPAGFGMLAGFAILLISAVITIKWKKSFGVVTVLIFLLFVFLLTPTALISDVPLRNECEGNVLANYEKAGQQLAAIIPAGAKVWWLGVNGPVSLLYLEDIQIYPPQLNDGFNFFVGGDSDYLWQHGCWNEELERLWFADADYAVIESPSFVGKYGGWFNPQEFDEFMPTDVVHQCAGDFYYRIFRRNANAE